MFKCIRILTNLLGVIGISSLIILPAYSQNKPINRINTSPRTTFFNQPATRINPRIQNLNGTDPTYPQGSRINSSGAIFTSPGQVIYPNAWINNGDGSTTYYYQNGTRVTVDKTKFPASGTLIR